MVEMSGLKISWSLGLKNPGLKYPLPISLNDISTPDFSIMNFSTPWFKNSWLKSLGLKFLLTEHVPLSVPL